MSCDPANCKCRSNPLTGSVPQGKVIVNDSLGPIIPDTHEVSYRLGCFCDLCRARRLATRPSLPDGRE